MRGAFADGQRMAAMCADQHSDITLTGVAMARTPTSLVRRLALPLAQSARVGQIPKRQFSCSRPLASILHAELTAPNGRAWTQPLGLFIDNQFVESKGGGRIASVNP